MKYTEHSLVTTAPCPAQVKAYIYTSVVQPILEYTSTAWDLYIQVCINEVKAVHRCAARFVKGDYHTTSRTSQMTADLGRQTLESRRKQAKVTMMYCIVNRLINFSPDVYLCPASSTTPGNTTHFIAPYCQYNHSRQHYPLHSPILSTYKTYSSPLLQKCGTSCQKSLPLHPVLRPSSRGWLSSNMISQCI